MKKLLIFVFSLVSILSAQGQDLSDWANYGRYEAANKEIHYPVKAVFMGNSITDNWASMHSEFFEKNNYVGRGISGQVSAQMLLRFRKDVINLKPQAVVILAGTNDIAHNDYAMTVDQTLDNVKSMVELAKQNKIKVVLCSALPAYEFGWRPGMKPAGQIMEYNKKLKAYAQANKIKYVDYHSAMKDDRNGLPAKYSNDGVHPVVDGYLVMEDLVQKVLKKMVK